MTYSRSSQHVARSVRRGWVLIVSSVMSLLVPVVAMAATAGLSGPSQVQVGRSFTVNLMVAGASDTDTARFIGTFPSDLLELQNTSNVSAFPNQSPGSSSGAGTFNLGVFSLGNPVSGTERAGVLTFKAKKVGTAKISLISGTRILSSGVDQLTDMGSLTIKITQGAAPGEIPIASERQIVLTSDSHPDSDLWYASREVDVTWKLVGPQPIATFIGFDQFPDGPAEQRVDGKTQMHFTATSDGVWYVHLIDRYSTTEAVRRDFRVQIDTIAPRKFSVVSDYTGVVSDIPNALRFAAIDDTSGIKQYDVYMNEKFLVATTGTALTLSRLDPGTYRARVRATDKAGNTTEASTTFLILPALESLIPTRASRWGYFLFFSLLLFFVGFLVGRWFLFAKRRKSKETES